MEIPDYQPFAFSGIEALRERITTLDRDIPLHENLAGLSTTVRIGKRHSPNRFCVQPMEGCDATPEGAPSPLTHQRYRRYAAGRNGTIWLEATAITPRARSKINQLCLTHNTLPAFKALVDEVRETARAHWGHDILLILQLAHAGPLAIDDTAASRPVIAHHNPVHDHAHGISPDYPIASDDDLENIRDAFVTAAGLAAEAGFDGVDLKTCHHDFLGTLLGARARPGPYGGSFDNRIRLLLDIFRAIRRRHANLTLTTRSSLYDAIPYPYGFGVHKHDPTLPDLTEPLALAHHLVEAGLDALNISPHTAPTIAATAHTAPEDETALRDIARKLDIVKTIRNAIPDLPVVVGNISWFRQFMPQVAAGLIDDGTATLIGLGRSALAYPAAAADIIANGRLVPTQTCMLCDACLQLIRNATSTGCVIRDPITYGPVYRHQRRFALDHLTHAAERCHNCENAPCSAACPAGIDVPAFIKAFAEDDIPRAYTVLQRANLLPEMCSHLCPGRLLCEGACIENTLSNRPIPICDLQYVTAWLGRTETDIGIPVPTTATGKHIAVVGAGPTGLSAAARLVGYGHAVTLFERGTQLGGTPEALIPAERYPSAQPEIAAMLHPAIESGRLTLQCGRELGADLTLDALRNPHAATLLAVGVWQEKPLSSNPPTGVMDALAFLAGVKQGAIQAVPKRVAILSGGDCAMDAARQAKALGTEVLYIIFAGARSDMHWHMDPAWTASEGVHLMTMTQPTGYAATSSGALSAVTCRSAAFPEAPETTLPVDFVVEAMGLSIADHVKAALPGIAFTDSGLVKTGSNLPFSTAVTGVFAAGGMLNGGATVAQCIAEGMQAANVIHNTVTKTKNTL